MASYICIYDLSCICWLIEFRVKCGWKEPSLSVPLVVLSRRFWCGWQATFFHPKLATLSALFALRFWTGAWGTLSIWIFPRFAWGFFLVCAWDLSWIWSTWPDPPGGCGSDLGWLRCIQNLLVSSTASYELSGWWVALAGRRTSRVGFEPGVEGFQLGGRDCWAASKVHRAWGAVGFWSAL